MSTNDRREQILNILNERFFVTVNELSRLTFISPSSIRRDLTYLENNGLVKRSYGGVSLPDPINGVASFHDRTQKSIREKRIIAQKASALLKDGQSILLDSSSTVTFLLPYIAKKEICVFTNNLSTALKSVELGINTHCLGGHAMNRSVVLSGAATYRALSDIRADIFFFSSQSIDVDGNISDSTEEENYIRALMLKAANRSVFLCDSQKFDTSSLYRLCNLNEVDIAVFDSNFDRLKTNCRQI